MTRNIKYARCKGDNLTRIYNKYIEKIYIYFFSPQIQSQRTQVNGFSYIKRRFIEFERHSGTTDP